MHLKDQFTVINRVTGEAHDITVNVPKRMSIGGNWLMIFQDVLFDMAINPAITPEAHRVFTLMFKYTDFENKIKISQREIAEILKIDAQRTSKAVKILVDQGIIVKVHQGEVIKGKRFNYLLSSMIGWKGRATNFHKFNEDQLKGEK